jgi:hypothetical protein
VVNSVPTEIISACMEENPGDPATSRPADGEGQDVII